MTKTRTREPTIGGGRQALPRATARSSNVLSPEKDAIGARSAMAHVAGALIGVAALLAGAAVAVLVAGGDERAVTHSTTMGGSLLAVILGAIILRQTGEKGKSPQVLALVSLGLGIVGLALWLLVMIPSAGPE
jgi:FtsH-binding integral membrane protein